MFSFDWTDFTEKDLIELNKSKNPMVYGYIYIEKNNKKYIADIQWSTVSAFGFMDFQLIYMNPTSFIVTVNGLMIYN